MAASSAWGAVFAGIDETSSTADALVVSCLGVRGKASGASIGIDANLTVFSTSIAITSPISNSEVSLSRAVARSVSSRSGQGDASGAVGS